MLLVTYLKLSETPSVSFQKLLSAKKKKHNNIKKKFPNTMTFHQKEIALFLSLENNQEKRKKVNILNNAKCKVDTVLTYIG